MPPTTDINYPDGMESNSKFWVIILFVLFCLGLCLAHSFNRKWVYRNSISPIEVKGTCLRCDLMYYGCLMTSLISSHWSSLIPSNSKSAALIFLSQRIVVTMAPDVRQTHTHQNFVVIHMICQKALVYTCERTSHILVKKSLFARKSKQFGISNFWCIIAFRGGWWSHDPSQRKAWKIFKNISIQQIFLKALIEVHVCGLHLAEKCSLTWFWSSIVLICNQVW